MKQLLLFILCIPLVSAGMFSDTLVFETNDNISLSLNISGLVTTPSCNTTIIDNTTIVEEELCENMTITGLPLMIEQGEKLSFGFSFWQDGDSVTYWVEDVHGEVLKDSYTTTSKTKKSYTPKIEGEERAIIFKAEREREGCSLSSAEAIVIVIGEENVCEELEPVVVTETCEYEENISSLYVRAEKWQENITLYGNVVGGGNYFLFGEESIRELSLEEGSFSVTINPVKGENKYGLVPITGGIPKTVMFLLTYEEEKSINATSINATLVIEPPLVTGGVIIENDTKKNTALIAGLSGLVGAGLVLSGLKTKLLRRRQDSV